MEREPMAPTYYEILGVRRTASPDAIKRAYRRLVKRYHPDVNPHYRAREMFLEVKEAYEVLSNTLLRREYDEKLGGPRTVEETAAHQDTRAPRKVRVPNGYIRMSPPFRGGSKRIDTVQNRELSRRARKAQSIWRIYVVSAGSMTGSLGVFGGYLVAIGATFQGAITLGSAVMMFALLLIAWLAKGFMASD